MQISLKLKKEGGTKLVKYSIIVIPTTKTIKTVYKEKIGNYSYYKDESVLFFSQKKYKFWQIKGIKLTKKLQKLFDYVK